MKKKLLALVVVCLCALSLGMFGCGGGGGGEEDASAAFIGNWKLVDITGEDVSAEDLELMESLGMTVEADFDADGNAQLVMFGEAMVGTWEAASASEGTITLEGQAVNMTIDNGQLSMEQGGDGLIFEKVSDTPNAIGADAAA